MKKPNTKSNTEQVLRPPVVAILGHVDHGKTSLLDAIRKTNVTASEHGGITQAIGAYQVEKKTKEGVRKITFIDTPGHEAFTKMRGRGVTTADIAILVVAANDGIMPQTRESIVHIKQANIPFIVALTKADLEAASPDRVKQQFAKEGVVLEGLGGDVPVVVISSKTGQGISDLLEMILLVSQLTGVAGRAEDPFEGVIIESKLDRRRGPVASVIVKKGTIAVGDELSAENIVGKVRALIDDTGTSIARALPGTPVEVLGFTQTASVGARVIKKRDADQFKLSHSITSISSQNLEKSTIDSEKPRLAVVIKADNLGSLEAILQSLARQDANILFATTGDITGADVLLAKASGAIIIGFNTHVSSNVAKLAETEGVLMKTYKLIYELLKELKEAISLFNEGKPQELVLGRAKVLATFPFNNKKIAGTKVLEGRIVKGDRVRIERGGEILGEARIVSLRMGKEDANKVEAPSECGILLSGELDFGSSDMILSVR